MGAYYEATLDTVRYDTHSLDNGLKLMEHSYLENNYCIAVEQKLLEKARKLIWLCDYHTPDSRCNLEWVTTDEKEFETSEVDLDLIKKNRYVINLDKGEYFSTQQLIDNVNDKDAWIIHPLPLLTNSETGSMGGGDYHEELSWRSSWCNDTIKVSLDKNEVENLNNISDSVTLTAAY